MGSGGSEACGAVRSEAAKGFGLSSSIGRLARGWVVLGTLAVFVLFTALVLPGQAAQAERASGGAGSPDTSLLYTPGQLYAMAERYGPAGRAAYIRARFTFDLVWPLVYTAFLTAGVAWAFGRVRPPASRWQCASLVPILAMGFDFLENLSTALVMARYPARTPVVDVLAPAFTLFKWVFVGCSFALLVVGLAWALVRWARQVIRRHQGAKTRRSA